MFVCLWLIILFGAICAGCPGDVWAVEIKYSSLPQPVGTAEFTLDTQVTGAADGQNYLRIDLYLAGTTQYFGETFNGNTWYGGSEGNQYFPIEIKSGSGSASLKGRVGNPTGREYAGPGKYMLRVRRYTASGNPASDTQTPVEIDINLPLVLPTPTPAASPHPTPSKNSAPASTAVVLPTLRPSPPGTLKPSVTYHPGSSVTAVLGAAGISPLPLSTSEASASPAADFRRLSGIFIFLGGLIFSAVAGWWAVHPRRRKLV